MGLDNCKKCGVLFNRRLRDICDNCVGIEKDYIEKINEYIQNRPDMFISMEEISENLDIDLDEVKYMYKNGRLVNIAGRIAIRCQACGAETRGMSKKGNFCDKCAQQIKEKDYISPFQEEKSESSEPKKNIMHSKQSPDSSRCSFKKIY